MSDEIKLPSKQELSELPATELGVYALRCALRVQPLLVLLGKPISSYRKAVVTLSKLSENLVYGDSTYSANNKASEAAMTARSTAARTATVAKASNAAAHVHPNAAAAAAAADAAVIATTDTSAEGAFRCARAAVASVKARSTPQDQSIANTVYASRKDFELLANLKTITTDASEAGPLGDLWHGSTPDWYIEAKAKYDNTIAEWEGELKESKGRDLAQEVMDSLFEMPVFPPNPAIELYIDPGDAKKETIQSVLECLSDLHIAAGGFGLEFNADDMNIKAMEGVTK
ncbi:hypothetical protein [Gimesia sp.]|uniref:hypothetical protein n=1 Tax=Gimesia sp. TaxID=2024833 RepID=UPI003A8E48F9